MPVRFKTCVKDMFESSNFILIVFIIYAMRDLMYVHCVGDCRTPWMICV